METMAGWVEEQLSGALGHVLEFRVVDLSPTSSLWDLGPVIYVLGHVSLSEKCVFQVTL